MKFRSFKTLIVFTFAVGSFTSGLVRGATVIDQIGDANSYDLNAAPGPRISQIFTDQAIYSSMVVEDFTVTGSGLRISAVSALFRAGSRPSILLERGGTVLPFEQWRKQRHIRKLLRKICESRRGLRQRGLEREPRLHGHSSSRTWNGHPITAGQFRLPLPPLQIFTTDPI